MIPRSVSKMSALGGFCDEDGRGGIGYSSCSWMCEGCQGMFEKIHEPLKSNCRKGPVGIIMKIFFILHLGELEENCTEKFL